LVGLGALKVQSDLGGASAALDQIRSGPAVLTNFCCGA
jgi:hypothetical protein